MRVCVIGAGASGMMAAITAARKGAFVTLIEHNDRVGKKLLVTGNGKCNLSSSKFDKNKYNCPESEVLDEVFHKFGVNKTLSFFEEIGVLTKVGKNNGYYPRSEQASVVLDALRREIERQNIELLTDYVITRIDQNKDGFSVVHNNEALKFDRIILCCGSMAMPSLGADGSGYKLATELGHKLNKPLPALTQFVCKEGFFKGISGVRQNGFIELYVGQTLIADEMGEIQFTDTGISGIPVFQLSRFAAYPLSQHRELIASIDFMKDYSRDDLNLIITNYRHNLKNTNVDEMLTAFINKKLAVQIRKNAGLEHNTLTENLTNEQIVSLTENLKEFKLHILKTSGYENAQICIGGIRLEEVKNSLESSICPGLYFAGEILDVDGDCGGFNLQWAWSSGYVAGYHAAKD